MGTFRIGVRALALFALIQLSVTSSIGNSCYQCGPSIDLCSLEALMNSWTYNTGHNTGHNTGYITGHNTGYPGHNTGYQYTSDYGNTGYPGCYGCWNGNYACPGSFSCNACCSCDIGSLVGMMADAYGPENVAKAFETYGWCNLCCIYNCLEKEDFETILNCLTLEDVCEFYEVVPPDYFCNLVCCMGADKSITIIHAVNSCPYLPEPYDSVEPEEGPYDSVKPYEEHDDDHHVPDDIEE